MEALGAEVFNSTTDLNMVLRTVVNLQECFSLKMQSVQHAFTSSQRPTKMSEKLHHLLRTNNMVGPMHMLQCKVDLSSSIQRSRSTSTLRLATLLRAVGLQ